MTNVADIKKRARTAFAKTQRATKDPRYARVLGRFVAEGLLVHNRIPAFRGPITLDEALWVGEWEPRVLELLPAVLLKRPGILRNPSEIPEDLREVLVELRHGRPEKPFRGVLAKDYAQWVPRIGRRGKLPSLLKTFRFGPEDIALIEKLKKRSGEPEITLVRRALQMLAKSEGRL